MEQTGINPDGVGIGTAAETPAQTMTARDVESVEAESHRVWSGTMDKIVESGTSQGDYFIKIGDKPTEDGTADERIIVLRTPVITRERNPQDKGYIVFTKDGPFAYTYIDMGPNSGEAEFLKRMQELGQGGINEGHFVNTVPGTVAEMRTAGYGSHERAMNFVLKPVRNPDLINEAIDQSIQKAESPHKQRVEDAKASIDVGNSVQSHIANLPSRE